MTFRSNLTRAVKQNATYRVGIVTAVNTDTKTYDVKEKGRNSEYKGLIADVGGSHRVGDSVKIFCPEGDVQKAQLFGQAMMHQEEGTTDIERS